MEEEQGAAEAIDVPHGVDPAGEKARDETVATLHRRKVLTADELYRLLNPRPRLEKEFRLPGAEGTVFMFSIDGMLDGAAMIGCLFAGECIMVQAKSFEAANRIAKAGLDDTVALLREEYEHRSVLVQPAANSGIITEASGARARESQGELHTDPKMKAMMAHIIGGEDWKR
jgi:hypothetical protein